MSNINFSDEFDHIPRVGEKYDGYYDAEIDSVEEDVRRTYFHEYAEDRHKYMDVPYCRFYCEFKITEEEVHERGIIDDEDRYITGLIWVNEYDYYGCKKRSDLEDERFEAYCNDFFFCNDEGSPFWYKYSRDGRDIHDTEIINLAKSVAENKEFALYLDNLNEEEYNSSIYNMLYLYVYEAAEKSICSYLASKFPKIPTSKLKKEFLMGGFYDLIDVDGNEFSELTIEIIDKAADILGKTRPKY